MRRLAWLAALAATPLAAQEPSLPVFPTDNNVLRYEAPTEPLPERRLPTVRERTVNERAQTGVNVVPRNVFGTRPRARPGAAEDVANVAPAADLTDSVTAPVAVSAVPDLADAVPGLADRLEGGAVTATAPQIALSPTPEVGEAATIEDGAVSTAVLENPAPDASADALQTALAVPAETPRRPRERPLQPERVAQVEESTGTDSQSDAIIVSPLGDGGSFGNDLSDGNTLPTFDTDAAIAEIPLDEPAGDAAQREDQPLGDEVISNRIVSEPLQPIESQPQQLRPRATPVVEVATAEGAVLRGLDKVSGQVRDVELAVGESAQFWRLDVSLGECRYPAQNPSGNAYAWLEIAPNGSENLVFEGWMVAASPALSALDHPRYDVWVIRCNNV